MLKSELTTNCHSGMKDAARAPIYLHPALPSPRLDKAYYENLSTNFPELRGLCGVSRRKPLPRRSGWFSAASFLNIRSCR